MRIYNSLSKKIEDFIPLDSTKVGMYTCGPTVYDYPTIGNYRTYTTADMFLRALRFFGYEVKYVMNLTDVGHLTGDNLGDADTGEDRMQKAAQREKKTAWDIAKYYSEDFISSFEKLNLIKPDVLAAATEHISEQIDLVEKLQQQGLVYILDDGVYFDVKKYENLGHDYSKLTTLDEIKEGARVAPNLDKRDPRDFALWKFSPKDQKRDMEWNSPWGMGFPGWHIECSAMSMKYLGESFDLHVGGEDLRSTHHPNEIAQSEGASGKPFVKYWVHGAFLTVDGGRMGKSLGNAYTLHDIENKKFDIAALRYLYMTAHYRKPLNFTWDALSAAQSALDKLRVHMNEFTTHKTAERTELFPEKLEKVDMFRDQFREAISNDLNMPQALAVVWETVKSNIPRSDKLDLLLSFDEVMGLGLSGIEEKTIPHEAQALISEREKLRGEGKYKEADMLRDKLKAEFGIEVKDVARGSVVR